MPRLAVVTGATGFMARHLVPALEEAGWDIRASGRRPRPEWLPAGVGYVPADLAGDEPIEPLVEGAAAVFHLAGATSSLSSPEQMHRSNVVATTRLVSAASTAGVGRMLHIGSTSVYGEEAQLPQPVVESVAPHPSRGYGKAKWGAEQTIWAAVAEGFPAVVLRPVSVFGPGAVKLLSSAILDVAIERYAGRRSLQVDAAPVELRLVHVADVVRATVHLAGAEGVCGRAYNVVASSYPSSLELASMLATRLGIELEACADPACGMPPAERRATWESMVAAGMDPSILFTQERLRFLKKANRNNRLSVEALLGTGFRFAYGSGADLAAGVAQTIDWYRAQRWIL